jgi:hypothetical protein
MLVGGMSTSDCLSLWSNAWCSRIWTLQEYALASKPVVMCGDHSIPWKKYFDLTPVAAGYLASLGSTDFENSQLKVGILQLVNRVVSKGLVSPSIDPVPRWMLAYFLAYAAEISQNNKSTNPLDKVYALYALLSGQTQDLPAVDYTRNQKCTLSELCHGYDPVNPKILASSSVTRSREQHDIRTSFLGPRYSIPVQV